jgi:hypothetical protein
MIQRYCVQQFDNYNIKKTNKKHVYIGPQEGSYCTRDLESVDDLLESFALMSLYYDAIIYGVKMQSRRMPVLSPGVNNLVDNWNDAKNYSSWCSFTIPSTNNATEIMNHNAFNYMQHIQQKTKVLTTIEKTIAPMNEPQRLFGQIFFFVPIVFLPETLLHNVPFANVSYRKSAKFEYAVSGFY